MSYLSIEFSVMFPGLFIIYWALRQTPKLQNCLLLAVSYAMVAAIDLNFLIILVCYTVILYAVSNRIRYSNHSNTWLTAAIIATIINLCFFKYFDFFRAQAQTVLQLMGINLIIPGIEIILPIGISFYTFHSISYLISLKKKEITTPSPLDFALFLAFFPSLVAGPINRAKDFLPQIQVQQPRQVGNYNKAFVLIVSALLKVLCLNTALADYLVDPVFNNPNSYHSLDILLAIYGYALQIYFNFSGYTDLVTAIALLLGFTLPINFAMPYYANNLRDFWQRWHITLSTWIRDYIYIPLGGSHCSFIRTQINLFIAMTLSGLWHGSNYTFIIWGMIHALGMILLNIGDHFTGRNYVTKWSAFIARFFTFHYVCLAWIFFRAATLEEANEFIRSLIVNHQQVSINFNIYLYFPLLFIAFISYPMLAKIPLLLEKLLEKIHWSILPIIWTFIFYVVLIMAPPGIPNFIYSSF